MFGFIIGYLAENILLKFNSDRRLVKHNSICNKDFPLKVRKFTGDLNNQILILNNYFFQGIESYKAFVNVYE